jgi:hypothetical protein
MTNLYFSNDTISVNDLYFVCYMIECVARKLRQKNKYVVNTIGKENLYHILSCAETLHCENPEKVANNWIEDYKLETGTFNITAVDPYYVDKIPSALDMGAVYQRLIVSTMSTNEDYVDGILRVYNDPICKKLDYYNCGAYYEPSYCITKAYQNKGF